LELDTVILVPIQFQFLKNGSSCSGN